MAETERDVQVIEHQFIPMMSFTVVAGYCGQKGTLTATKKIELPSFPPNGLCLMIDGIEFIVNINDILDLQWDTQALQGKFHLKDLSDSDPGIKHLDNLDSIAKWFTSQNWEAFDLAPDK